METQQEFINLLVLGHAGIALDLLFKLKGYIALKTKPNIWLIILNLLTSSVATTALIYVRSDIQNIFVVTPVGAIILGYTAQGVFRKLTTSFNKKSKSDD